VLKTYVSSVSYVSEICCKCFRWMLQSRSFIIFEAKQVLIPNIHSVSRKKVHQSDGHDNVTTKVENRYLFIGQDIGIEGKK